MYCVISHFWSFVQRIYVFLDKVDSHAQNAIDMTICFINIVLICSLPYISLSTPLFTKHAQACHQQDGFFILQNICVLFTFESIYLKYLKYLQSEQTFESIITNNIWTHFYYRKSDYTFHVFWLHNWLIYFFFLYMAIFHIIWWQEGVGIHRKLITDWIELAPSIILVTTQLKTKIKILFGKAFRK